MAGREHHEAARLSSGLSQPGSRQTLDDSMTDQHQVHSIIATAICDALKQDPDHRMDAEEAKQIAKCIIEALSDAGLQIAPLGKK
jgi:hypothetical protein